MESWRCFHIFQFLFSLCMARKSVSVDGGGLSVVRRGRFTQGNEENEDLGQGGFFVSILFCTAPCMGGQNVSPKADRQWEQVADWALLRFTMEGKRPLRAAC